MNKKILFLSLLTVSLVLPLTAQAAGSEKIETEYYGLTWGCSPKELLSKYPAAYPQGTNDTGDQLYYLDANGATRIFFFGNDKLYAGRIAYTDCTDEKAMALMTKTVETYGKFDDSSKGSQNGNEYINLIRNYSRNIEIDFLITSLKNAYGYTVSQAVMITYQNNNLYAQIAKERINKMQEDLEL